jgi:hypothetical protein
MKTADQLSEDEGEIVGLTVKEVSLVNNPAVPMAKFLIVKEADGPEDDDGDDDSGDIDVLLKKDAMSTDSAAPLRPNAKQGKCEKCSKEMSGEGDICKCTHKEDTEIAKEPVVQNTEMVTPTVSDETKMELQRTLKELVANSGSMNSKDKLRLAKVAAYHGVDVPDVEEEQESEGTSLDDVLAALQKLVPVLVALQPKPAAPTPPAASPTPKPAATASASMTKKESDDLKDGPGHLITLASLDATAKPETPTLVEEILVETVKEVASTEEPLLTRVARILEKQREQHELDEYMSVLKGAAKKIQSVHNEYSETKRSLLKAMGKDPDFDLNN